MLAVVKVVTAFPPVKIVPPVLAAYQSNVDPEDAVALMITGPVPVLALSIGKLTTGSGCIVIVIVLDAKVPSIVVMAFLLK